MRTLLKGKILYAACFLSFSYVASAQSLVDMLPPSTSTNPSLPGQVYGIDRVVDLMQRRAGTTSNIKNTLQPICYEANPSFLFSGPDLTRSFQGEPSADGRALVLHGEIMMAIGQVLLQQGRALLEGSSKTSEP
jgi:hypothetical protein